MGLIVGDEPGGIDKRRHERVAAHLKISFREINDEDAERLSEQMSIGAAAAAAAPAPISGKTGLTENISEGGISVTGDLELLASRKLEQGKKLLVDIELPGEARPVEAVAVVCWSIEGKGATGKFTAGLMFTGIDQKDLDRIQAFLAKSGG